MKDLILISTLMLLLVGCADQSTESKYQGKIEKKDYISIAMRYLSQKDVVNAIRNFDMAIKEDPKNPKNYLVLAEVYLRLKNYPRAIDTFTAVTKIDDKNADAFYMLAMSLSLRNKPEDVSEAINAVKRSAELYKINNNQQGFINSMALFKELTEKENIPAQ